VRLGLLANSLLPEVINEYFLLRVGPQMNEEVDLVCTGVCYGTVNPLRLSLGRILDSSFLSFSAGEPMQLH